MKKQNTYKSDLESKIPKSVLEEDDFSDKKISESRLPNYRGEITWRVREQIRSWAMTMFLRAYARARFSTRINLFLLRKSLKIE